MSISSITPLFAGSGTIDDKFKRSYSITWQVVTTTGNDGPATVLTAVRAAVLNYYSYGSEADLGAFLKSMSCSLKDQQNDFTVWIVTGEYSSDKDKRDSSTTATENPLARHWDVSWSTETYQRVATKDIDGDPIQNTADEDFVDPAEVERSRLQLTVRRNEAYFDAAKMLTYVDTVNKRKFYGSEPQTAKIKSISASEKVENTEEGQFRYYEVTYVIQFRQEGWLLSLLNQGLRKKISDGVYVKMKDESGQPLTKPVLLNEAGDDVLGADEDPVFIDFQVYEEKDFGALNLEAVPQA